ncbi:class I SAM-dependent methyltransferase [Microbacterium sp.]|uniref:class I SAM-dependent methyltransferase n=1 Tax=Microbacterium sp. TaxID=51671 RepID=UPI003F9D9208
MEHRPEHLDNIIEAWERQQDAYVARRAERFGIILDTISYTHQAAATILDIGGGLGSFSKLLLERFPQASVITLDYDPALLELARYHLREYGERSVIVEANLVDPAWPAVLSGVRPDVVVSSTALHWLSSAQLVALYEQLASVISKGGLFCNADHLSHVTAGSLFHTASAADAARQQEPFEHGVPDWDGWWDQFRELDEFTALIDERDRRFADGEDNIDVTAQLHVEALRVGGFTESGTLWQYFDDYVVYGVR